MDDLNNQHGKIKSAGVSKTAYSEEFLRELGEQFQFDFLGGGIAQEIRLIGRLYLIITGIINDKEAKHIERADYMRLQDKTDHLLELLAEFKDRDIATDIFYAALENKEPAPTTEFNNLTLHQTSRGEPYFYELVRLLRLLRAGTERPIKNLAPGRGRPIDAGLELLVRRAADIWVFKMERRFSVDYHKGSGLTPTFEFIQALIKPLTDMQENKIITQMRKEIATRRKLGIPTEPKSDS